MQARSLCEEEYIKNAGFIASPLVFSPRMGSVSFAFIMRGGEAIKIQPWRGEYRCYKTQLRRRQDGSPCCFLRQEGERDALYSLAENGISLPARRWMSGCRARIWAQKKHFWWKAPLCPSELPQTVLGLNSLCPSQLAEGSRAVFPGNSLPDTGK